jgi:tetratricopeptide (TPR) repeat protein
MTFRKNIFLLVLILFVSSGVFSTDWVVEKIKAEKLYNEGKYDEAIILFREIILSSKNEKFIAESYFWLGRAYINTNKLKLAETNLEYYIANYKTTGLNYPEALYEKGRLLFLQEQYQPAIEQLNIFIKNYPANSLVSNSYYWIGESLYAMGQYDDASYYFKIVSEKYANSAKAEASIFKLRLIEHKKSELALQNLLKWSQEQYLAALSQFRIKEKTLQEALDKYKSGNTGQTQSTSGSGDNKKLQEENNALKNRVNELENENSFLKGNINDKKISDRVKQLELKEKLLKDKEEALRILESNIRAKGK